MSSNDIAIRVTNLSKRYEIYATPRDRLKQFVVPRVARLVGHVRKQYFREFWALQDVSFEIKKGETVGIIGRNGSGKSTLLQMLCGTLHPSSGKIEVNGRVAALLELGAGFNPEFTGRENVFLSASLYGLGPGQIAERFDQIVAFADIGDFIDQPVKTYSSGMFVRLAFAVIANVDADILVIDEALAVGDAYFVQKCMRFLKNFTQHGTLLFVSHDTSAVVGLCSKAILMNGGRPERIGSPKDVSEYYLAMLHEEDKPPKGVGVTKAEDGNLANVQRVPGIAEIDAVASTNTNDFGTGLARIVSVKLVGEFGNPISAIAGGEKLCLEVYCLAESQSLNQPIVGFIFKDRLGQAIFGSNTYLTYQSSPPTISAGEYLCAKFEFIAPVLPGGQYSICVAFANGTQQSHVQHHWIHDALIVQSIPNETCFGLIGIPMIRIELKKQPRTELS